MEEKNGTEENELAIIIWLNFFGGLIAIAGLAFCAVYLNAYASAESDLAKTTTLAMSGAGFFGGVGAGLAFIAAAKALTFLKLIAKS
jgi:hypothetical protein